MYMGLDLLLHDECALCVVRACAKGSGVDLEAMGRREAYILFLGNATYLVHPISAFTAPSSLDV